MEEAMSRGILAALTAAGVAFASYALMHPAQAATTVKSSKSNGSERMGGGGGHGQTTKVKTSKSNGGERTGGWSDDPAPFITLWSNHPDRMGGGGGGRGGTARGINLNSGRSNKY
jgi:opacity protein-like surface antigen